MSRLGVDTKAVEALAVQYRWSRQLAGSMSSTLGAAFDELYWRGTDRVATSAEIDDVVTLLGDLAAMLSGGAELLGRQIAEQRDVSARRVSAVNLSGFTPLGGTSSRGDADGGRRAEPDRDRSDRRNRNDDASRGRGRDLPEIISTTTGLAARYSTTISKAAMI